MAHEVKGDAYSWKSSLYCPMQNSWNTLAAYSLLQFWLDPVIEYSVFYIFRKLSTEIQQSGAFNRISFPSWLKGGPAELVNRYYRWRSYSKSALAKINADVSVIYSSLKGYVLVCMLYDNIFYIVWEYKSSVQRLTIFSPIKIQ